MNDAPPPSAPPAGDVAPVVRIAGVAKTFVTDHARVTTALQGIDLDIADQAVTG